MGFQRDIGALVPESKVAVDPFISQGADSCRTALVSRSALIIDRINDLARRYLSAVVEVPITILNEAATCVDSVALQVQDAAGSSGPFADYWTSLMGSASSGVSVSVGTSSSSVSSSQRTVLRLNVDLTAARQFIQAVVTVGDTRSMASTSSSGSAALLSLGGTWLFGGAEELPKTLVD